MTLDDMSPAAIAEELGNRLRKARLNANFSQIEVSARAGLSRRTILNAEKGKVQLKHFVAILASLDLLDQLNMFLPVQEISPIQLAKLKGQERQRASKSKSKKAGIHEEKSSW